LATAKAADGDAADDDAAAERLVPAMELMAPPDDEVAVGVADDEQPPVSSRAAATIAAAPVEPVFIASLLAPAAVDRPRIAYQTSLTRFPGRRQPMPAARVAPAGPASRLGHLPGRAGSFALPRIRGKRGADECLPNSIVAVCFARAGC
jgi:hypothetical protein